MTEPMGIKRGRTELRQKRDANASADMGILRPGGHISSSIRVCNYVNSKSAITKFAS